MNDMSGHGLLDRDSDLQRPTLSVHDVSQALEAAGVPRSERQIKRYCESGFLDATKIPGPNGEQWFAAPASIPKLVGDLKQWQAQRGTRPAASDHVIPEPPRKTDADTPGHGLPDQAASAPQDQDSGGVTNADMSGSGRPLLADNRYVTQLERENEFLRGEIATKNKQIADATERARETNILIRGLQNLVLQLQAPSRLDKDAVAADASEAQASERIE